METKHEVAKGKLKTFAKVLTCICDDSKPK